MTVQTTNNRVEYTGNGSTTAFPVTFVFLQSADIKVYVDGTLKTITTDYTVSGGSGQTGTVTFLAAPANTAEVVILRDPAITQATDLRNQAAFYAEVHENAFDKLTMITQRLDDRLDRAFTLPDTDTSGASTVIPSPEANKIVSWNDTATALQNVDPQTLATVVAFGTANADVFDGDGVTTQFTLSNNPGALNNLDVSIGGVTQTPVIDYTWTSGTTITFTSAPPAGTDNVLVRYMQGLPQGSTDADLVSYTPAGIGAVDTNVQAKLRESVSVFDFMTVGEISDITNRTALIDVSAKIQAAFNAVRDGTVLIPAGEYRVNSDITLLLKGHSPNEGAFRLEATGAFFVGTGRLIVDSSKRVQINGLDMANMDLVFRGCWWGQFSNMRFKRLHLGDASGTDFSSNYWNVFAQCQLQTVLTDAASAGGPHNEFSFEQCSMRGSADQGFSGTAAYAFELNADDNCQSWKFNGGDISYHTTAIYNVGAGNTSGHVELAFNGVYFDTLLPSQTSRTLSRIFTNNCHHAAASAYSASLAEASSNEVDWFRADRMMKHNANSNYNLIPNGDFSERLTTWVGTGLPLQGTSGGVVTRQDGGVSGNYLNINQAATTSNSARFRARALPYAGKTTYTIIMRNANVGSKSMRVQFGSVFATIQISNTEWTVARVTPTDVKAEGSTNDIVVFTDDSTAYNIDVAYVGITLGIGGAVLNPSAGVKTIKHEEVYDPPNIVAGSSTTKDFTVNGATVGDFVLVAPGNSLGFLTLGQAHVISANTVRVRITNTTAGDIDISSSTWGIKVFKREYL